MSYFVIEFLLLYSDHFVIGFLLMYSTHFVIGFLLMSILCDRVSVVVQ